MDGSSTARWRVRVVEIIPVLAIDSVAVTVGSHHERLANYTGCIDPSVLDRSGRWIHKRVASYRIDVRDDQGLHTARLHRNHAGGHTARVRRIKYLSRRRCGCSGIREVAVRKQPENASEEDR